MAKLVAIRKGDSVVITRASRTNKSTIASSCANKRPESKDSRLTSLLMPEQLKEEKRTSTDRKIDRPVTPNLESKTFNTAKSLETVVPLPVPKCDKDILPVIITRSPSNSSLMGIKSPKLGSMKPHPTCQIDKGTQVERKPVGFEVPRVIEKICKITLPSEPEIVITSKDTEGNEAPVTKSKSLPTSPLKISKSPSPTPPEFETDIVLNETSIQNDATRPGQKLKAKSKRISTCDDKKPPSEQRKQDKATRSAATMANDIGFGVDIVTSKATSPSLKLNDKLLDPVFTILPSPVLSRPRSPCPGHSMSAINRPPSPPVTPKAAPSECGSGCQDQAQTTHEQIVLVLVIFMLLQVLTLTLPTLILLLPPRTCRHVKK